MKEERVHLPFLFLFTLLLYLSFLGGRDLWSPVEPRYGEIVRVMFSRGEWIVPTVNGSLYTDKPILYFWLVLIFSHLLGGVSEWSLRLPSALSAIGLSLITYRMGSEFFGARVGLLASLIFATLSRVLLEGRWAHTDMLFSFCFTASVYLLLRRWHGRSGSSEALVAYALMGLATLTKGMIGFVLPGMIFLCLLIMRKDGQGWSRLNLIPGTLIFLLVIAPWFVVVALQTQGEWLSEFIWTHHVQRYLDSSGHRRPFYYYLINLPVDLAPWTPLLIPAAVAAWNRRRIALSPVALTLVTWAIVVFVFFSLSDTKRGLYLLPMYPTVALWLAHALVAGEQRGSPVPWGFRPVAILYSALLLLTALSLPVVTYWVQPDLLGGTLFPALIMALGSCAAYLSFHRSQLCSGSLWLAVMFLGFVISNAYWVFPTIDRYKSPRAFVTQVQARVQSEEQLYIYKDTMNTFNYYLNREVIRVLSSPEELASVNKGEDRAYLMIKGKDLRRVPEQIKLSWQIVAEGTVGSKIWSLYRLAG